MVEAAILLATDADGRWRIGVGDPSVAGWLTVAGYVVAAFLCARAFAAARRRPVHSHTGASRRRSEAWFWIGLVVVMTALALNKQLDLQSLFTEVVRDLAIAQGWYEQRHSVQRAFVIGLAGGGLVVAGALGYALRRLSRASRGAAVGALLLFAFVVLRAASFHRVDLAGASGSLWLARLLEFGGIAVVAACAGRAARPARSAPPGPARRAANA